MSDPTTPTFTQLLAVLPTQQQRFVLAYVDCLNGAEAARRSGSKAKRPQQQAYEYLTKPDIKAAVDAGFRERAMSRDEIIGRLGVQAAGDMGDFLRVDEEEVTLTWSLLSAPLTEDGEVDIGGATLKLAMQENVKPTDRVLHTATVKRHAVRLDFIEAGRRGKLGLIKKYSIDPKDGKESLELYDAQAALITLAKHHNLFKEAPGAGGVLLNFTPEQLAAMSEEELAELGRKRGLL